MTETEIESRGVHWSFWIIGAVALIWNTMGAINFFLQMNAGAVASFSEQALAIINGRPLWATAGFAVAVFGGSLGCLILLIRNSISYYVFIVSFLGVMVTTVHGVSVAASTADFSIGQIVMMILMPIAVAAFLIWYSKRVLG